MTNRAKVTPGTISPLRKVPAGIARPEYVGHADAREGYERYVKDAETIEKIRVAGQIAAGAMEEAGKAVRPGVTTDELDRIAHEYMLDHGAYPSTLEYRGFPKSLCTSVNEVICHGIPDSSRLEDGDIVKIDVTAYKDGVHGDNCATYLCGDVAEEARLLAERTKEAMMRGIKAARPGREVNVIGRVIEAYAHRFGYGVVQDYTGHGIGTEFHNGLIIPHYDSAPMHNDVIEVGMVFTVEPMLNLGSGEAAPTWDDGWTVVTADGSWSAQFENTIVITESGPEILTVAPA